MNEIMENYTGFRSLEREELYQTRGGVLAAIAAGLIIAAGAAIINDWDNFKAGLMGRPEMPK
jgi:hypothetical protein